MMPRMHRLAVAVLVTLSAFVAAAPALADDCPQKIRQIYLVANKRFDRAAYDAKDKAALAARLHAEGRHADAMKLAAEGLRRLDFDTPPPRAAQPTP